MTDVIQRCSVCQALIDEEDLFCANCGAEARAQAASTVIATTSTADEPIHFDCPGCGAGMSFDADAGDLRCPFCGTTGLKRQEHVQRQQQARAVVFQITHEQATEIMRKWLGRGFWRPGNLARAATIQKITAVYIPYWVFQATTHTYWTADSSQTPFGARGDWFPVTGEHRGQHDGLLVGASGALTPQETLSLCPFDLGQTVSSSDLDSRDAIVEEFRVKRKYARPLARQNIESLERKSCGQYVPARRRNVKVNVRIEGLTSDAILLPVWIMAYQYKERVYRFLINGQTGRATGQAPTSLKKVFVATLIGLAILLLAVLAVSQS